VTSAVGKLVGPLLGAMQHAQDPHRLAGHLIGRAIRRSCDDQFARTGDAARATAVGKIAKTLRRRDDPLDQVSLTR